LLGAWRVMLSKHTPSELQDGSTSACVDRAGGNVTPPVGRGYGLVTAGPLASSTANSAASVVVAVAATPLQNGSISEASTAAPQQLLAGEPGLDRPFAVGEVIGASSSGWEDSAGLDKRGDNGSGLAFESSEAGAYSVLQQPSVQAADTAIHLGRSHSDLSLTHRQYSSGSVGLDSFLRVPSEPVFAAECVSAYPVSTVAQEGRIASSVSPIGRVRFEPVHLLPDNSDSTRAPRLQRGARVVSPKAGTYSQSRVQPSSVPHHQQHHHHHHHHTQPYSQQQQQQQQYQYQSPPSNHRSGDTRLMHSSVQVMHPAAAVDTNSGDVLHSLRHHAYDVSSSGNSNHAGSNGTEAGSIRSFDRFFNSAVADAGLVDVVMDDASSVRPSPAIEQLGSTSPNTTGSGSDGFALSMDLMPTLATPGQSLSAATEGSSTRFNTVSLFDSD